MAEYVSSPQFIKITSQLRQSGYLSDAKIILDDDHTYYDVHRLLLAAHSQFFRVLFSYEGSVKPGQPAAAAVSREQVEYHLSNVVTKEGFDPIISWMYDQEVKLSRDNVETILRQAHYLDCKEIIEQCVNFILEDITADNALGYARFARAYNIAELEQQCTRYVKYNFVEIAKTMEFLELLPEELTALLDSEDLNAKEHHVWAAVVRWVWQDHVRRVRHVSDLLRRIRIGQFTEEFFRQTMGRDLQDLGPLEAKVEELLSAAERYFKKLESVSKVERPLKTPSWALPRLSQDVILAFGGWTGGRACNLIESYDIRADRWTPLPNKDPFGERGYIGATAIGSKMYLVGGTNGEMHFNATSCFDVETGTYSELGPMYSGRCYVSLVEQDGCLYAIGGASGSRRLNTVEKYQPKKNQWTLVAPMLLPRSDAGCASLGGKIYAAGGFDGITQLDSVEVYTPKNNTWSTVMRMSTRRSGMSCVALNGELYALGGFDGNRRLRSCEKYDPMTKKWTPIHYMMTPRSNFSAVVVEGTIMVIGGYDGTTTTALVECYDPVLNSWCSSSDLTVPRSALRACVVRGNVLPGKTLAKYAYPNRDKLPEEKRLHERRRMRV